MLKKKRYILRGEEQLRNCLRYLTEEVTLPDGKEQKKPYAVTIEPHVESLSREQQGWFHFLCEYLGNQIGYTEGEIKDMVKERVFGVDEKMGPDGKVYRFVKSSQYTEDGKKRNKIDYGRLIDGVYLLGGEAGVILPEPDKFRRAS